MHTQESSRFQKLKGTRNYWFTKWWTSVPAEKLIFLS